jgi:A/G-specific adenine glycosylase
VVARAVHGMAEAGPPSTSRDLSDVDGVLPESQPARFSAALMELGAVLCTARRPRCADCPVAGECAWMRAGRPAGTASGRPAQRFAGTDRQVRGLLLDVLRAAADPVPRARLDAVWLDVPQRDRCLGSLLADGLVEQTRDGRFALPGEH